MSAEPGEKGLMFYGIICAIFGLYLSINSIITWNENFNPYAPSNYGGKPMGVIGGIALIILGIFILIRSRD